jgi:hypothetical protein
MEVVPAPGAGSAAKPAAKKGRGRPKGSGGGKGRAKADEGPYEADPREEKYQAELQEVLSAWALRGEGDRPDYRMGVDDDEAMLEAARACAAEEGGALPEAVVPLVARLVQGSRLPLGHLTTEVVTCLTEKLVPCVEGLSEAALQDKIRVIAERKCFGQRRKGVVIPDDTAVEAVWAWEVIAPEVYLPPNSKAALKAANAERKAAGNQAKALCKLLEVGGVPTRACACVWGAACVCDGHVVASVMVSVVSVLRCHDWVLCGG